MRWTENAVAYRIGDCLGNGCLHMGDPVCIEHAADQRDPIAAIGFHVFRRDWRKRVAIHDGRDPASCAHIPASA